MGGYYVRWRLPLGFRSLVGVAVLATLCFGQICHARNTPEQEDASAVGRRHIIIGVDVSKSMEQGRNDKARLHRLEEYVLRILYQSLPTKVAPPDEVIEKILRMTDLDPKAPLYRDGDLLTLFTFADSVKYEILRKRQYVSRSELKRMLPSRFKGKHSLITAAKVAALENYLPDDRETYFILLSDEEEDRPSNDPTRQGEIDDIASTWKVYGFNYHLKPSYVLKVVEKPQRRRRTPKVLWANVFKVVRLKEGTILPQPVLLVKGSGKGAKLPPLKFKPAATEGKAVLVPGYQFKSNPQLGKSQVIKKVTAVLRREGEDRILSSVKIFQGEQQPPLDVPPIIIDAEYVGKDHEISFELVFDELDGDKKKPRWHVVPARPLEWDRPAAPWETDAGELRFSPCEDGYCSEPLTIKLRQPDPGRSFSIDKAYWTDSAGGTNLKGTWKTRTKEGASLTFSIPRDKASGLVEAGQVAGVLKIDYHGLTDSKTTLHQDIPLGLTVSTPTVKFRVSCGEQGEPGILRLIWQNGVMALADCRAELVGEVPSSLCASKRFALTIEGFKAKQVGSSQAAGDAIPLTAGFSAQDSQAIFAKQPTRGQVELFCAGGSVGKELSQKISVGIVTPEPLPEQPLLLVDRKEGGTVVRNVHARWKNDKLVGGTLYLSPRPGVPAQSLLVQGAELTVNRGKQMLKLPGSPSFPIPLPIILDAKMASDLEPRSTPCTLSVRFREAGSGRSLEQQFPLELDVAPLSEPSFVFSHEPGGQKPLDRIDLSARKGELTGGPVYLTVTRSNGLQAVDKITISSGKTTLEEWKAIDWRKSAPLEIAVGSSLKDRLPAKGEIAGTIEVTYTQAGRTGQALWTTPVKIVIHETTTWQWIRDHLLWVILGIVVLIVILFILLVALKGIIDKRAKPLMFKIRKMGEGMDPDEDSPKFQINTGEKVWLGDKPGRSLSWSELNCADGFIECRMTSWTGTKELFLTLPQQIGGAKRDPKEKDAPVAMNRSILIPGKEEGTEDTIRIIPMTAVRAAKPKKKPSTKPPAAKPRS